jgi:hypothetical protein
MDLEFKTNFAAGSANSQSANSQLTDIKQQSLRSQVCTENSFETKLSQVRNDGNTKEVNKKGNDSRNDSHRVRENTDCIEPVQVYAYEAEKPVDEAAEYGVTTTEAVQTEVKDGVSLNEEQAHEIIVAIAEIMNIPPERVQEIFEMLGISPVDILDRENLNKFIMEANQLNEPVELLKMPEFSDVAKAVLAEVAQMVKAAGQPEAPSVQESTEGIVIGY